MKQYEYKCVTYPLDKHDPVTIAILLSGLGEKGWRVISSWPIDDTPWFLLEREKDATSSIKN